MTKQSAVCRRGVLQGIASSICLTVPGLSMASIDSLLKDHYGESSIDRSALTLELPTLAENGNSVPMKVRYKGSETVRSLKVFAPENPEPLLAEFSFGQSRTEFELSTRVRLANSQTLMAVVQTEQGNLFADTAETVITLAACIEPLL